MKSFPRHSSFLARISVLMMVLLIVALASLNPVQAQIPQGTITIALEPVASGLASPVLLTHAGDGSGRLFVVDQAGTILVIENGVLLATPFLDLTDRIPNLGVVFDERGALGLAFHPNYAVNGRFFVRYSAPRSGDPSEPCNDPGGFIVGCHKEVLSEFHVSTTNPNIADPNSEIVLFEVDEPQFNHDAGDVHFGPDGFLYFTFGDGGGAHDGLADVPITHGVTGHGQNIETPLGAMLRIDVDGGVPYAIPLDNPFLGVAGLDEIYAYGFRNPYRFTFDSLTGELILADVGQALFEEINSVVNGGNYGWVIREGAHCFDPLDPGVPPATCSTAGLVDPFAEYDHSDGLAIIGGFVYRGSQFPQLLGKYVFGDFSRDFGPTGRLFYLDIVGDRSAIREFKIGIANAPLGLFVKGFGLDAAGEIYVLTSEDLAPSGTSGRIFRIVSPPTFRRGDANVDGVIDIADPTFNLNYLFSNGPSFCLDAQDTNDDGGVNIGDPIFSLQHQFKSGPPPPAPFALCGQDPTADHSPGGDLGCVSSAPGCP